MKTHQNLKRTWEEESSKGITNLSFQNWIMDKINKNYIVIDISSIKDDLIKENKIPTPFIIMNALEKRYHIESKIYNLFEESK